MFLALALIIFFVFGAYLFLNKKQFGFLKKWPFIALAALSAGWWVFLVIDLLKYTPVCTPDDELCISGQTVWGDVTYGTFLAFFSLFAVWFPAILISHIVISRRSNKRRKAGV